MPVSGIGTGRDQADHQRSLQTLRVSLGDPQADLSPIRRIHEDPLTKPGLYQPVFFPRVITFALVVYVRGARIEGEVKFPVKLIVKTLWCSPFVRFALEMNVVHRKSSMFLQFCFPGEAFKCNPANLQLCIDVILPHTRDGTTK